MIQEAVKIRVHDPSNNYEVETDELKTIPNVLHQEIMKRPVQVYSPAGSDLYFALKLLYHSMKNT